MKAVLVMTMLLILILLSTTAIISGEEHESTMTMTLTVIRGKLLWPTNMPGVAGGSPWPSLTATVTPDQQVQGNPECCATKG